MSHFDPPPPNERLQRQFGPETGNIGTVAHRTAVALLLLILQLFLFCCLLQVYMQWL